MTGVVLFLKLGIFVYVPVLSFLFISQETLYSSLVEMSED